MSFLPQDYEAPKVGGFYMKLQDGENKIRILTAPILGWEDWDNKKPVRFRYADKPCKAIDPKKPFKHFWAMVVWNYTEEQVQILHLTQASIRKTIETLSKSEEWGAPYFYDIKITKTGKDMDTEYQAMPLPHKKVAQDVVDAFNKRKCCLEALFDNLDPFSEDYDVYTQGIFTKDDLTCSISQKIEPIVKDEGVITHEQATNLENMIAECSPTYQENVKIMLKKLKIESVFQLPKNMYELFNKTAADQRLKFLFEAE